MIASVTQYIPQIVPTRQPLIFWLISAAIVSFLVALIFAAPVAAAKGHNEWAEVIYRAFGIFCHQRPDRSYFIEGHKLAVFSRCTGLYAGFAITLLLYPVIRSLRTAANPPRIFLILAAIPLGVD